MSNSNKDLQIVESLKQLAQAALQSDKADLSTIIDTMINDSPKDIVRTIQKGEAAKYARDKQAQDQQAQVQQAQIKAQQDAVAQQLADKDKDRQLKQYEIDSNNETKLQVAQINVYSRQEDLDQDNDGIPDPIELGKLSMQERNIASKAFNEKMKLDYTKQVKDKEMSIKEKEIANKKEIEDKKIEAIRVQNVSQEKISKEESARSDRELNAKIQIEKLKLAAAKAKANNPKK
jgi:hypothetical protein